MLTAKEFYNRTYGVYNKRHENPYTKLLRKKEIGLIKKHASGLILDFGCGTGFHLNYMKNVIGYDISENMLRAAKNTGKPLMLGDENLPVKNNSIDTITCFLTVLNMCDYRKTLKEFSRVIKPGGLVITSVASIYDNNAMREKVINVSGNKMKLHLFSKNEIVGGFEKNGFKLLHFGSIFRFVNPRWGDLKPLGLKEKMKLGLEFLAPKERGCMYLFVFQKNYNSLEKI